MHKRENLSPTSALTQQVLGLPRGIALDRRMGFSQKPVFAAQVWEQRDPTGKGGRGQMLL